MQPNTRQNLVSMVEEHISGVVREAVVCQRHCKRARRIEADDGIRSRLTASDVNTALRLLGSEKLYAVGVSVPPTGSNNNGQQKVALQDFLKHDNLPKAPSEVGIRMHWLAVDGVQPLIPQNPAYSLDLDSGRLGSDAAGQDTDDAVVATKATTTLDDTTEGLLQVHQLQSVVLSEELQLYFGRVIRAMQERSNTMNARQQQDAVLASLSSDNGLQELTPFLVRYCQQEIYKCVSSDILHCETLVRLAVALLRNPHLHLELHLHELLPALMTCVVVNKPSTDPSHWALRRNAAEALYLLCNQFGDEYVLLKSRVLKTLCDATAVDKSFASRYGGIVAITRFGHKAIDAFLLPSALDNWREWEQQLALLQENKADGGKDSRSAAVATLVGIQMCQRALLDALGVFWRCASLEDKVERLDWQELEDALADRWVVFLAETDDYAFCLV